MAHRKLGSVLATFRKKLNLSLRLAVAAERWTTMRTQRGVPKFTAKYRDIVIEVAYLQAFMAWEAFLEESFVLYLLGKRSPKSRRPRRYVYPPNRRKAERFVAEGRDYADWTVTSKVVDRADRFFYNGGPYSNVLKSQQNKLDEMKTVRNALVHASINSQEKFETLARYHLRTLPVGLTPGSFLTLTIPGSSPPESYLESYVDHILFAAERIVPT